MADPAATRQPSDVAGDLPTLPRARSRQDRAESLGLLAASVGGCLGAHCRGAVLGGYCAVHRYLDASTSLRSNSIAGPEAAAALKAVRETATFSERSQKMIEASEGATIQSFLEALREISSCTDPHQASQRIIEQACKLLKCHRASIFYVDDEAQELILMMSKDAKTIRLKIGEGIAGSVAQTGTTLLVDDAYADPRFNRDADVQTEYKTRNILCTPIRDYSGELVGVLQAINKLEGGFTPIDRILIENLSSHTGIVLQNTFLYEQARSNEQRVRTLLDMIQMLHSDAPVHSVLFSLVQKAGEIAAADKATLFLHDPDSEQLVVMQSELNTRIPTSKGISGFVARTAQTLNIEDAYDDDRFNPEFDIATGYRTTQILCMPMLGSRGTVVGVLQVINKQDDAPFTEQDQEILSTLLKISGPVIEKSSLYQSVCFKKPHSAVADSSAVFEPPSLPRASSRDKIPETVMETISE